MIAAEAKRPDGIEVVSVVTPNHVHYPQSAACLEAGIDVICDKPLTTNLADAEKLVKLAADKKRLLGVTFNYTGYPMIRHAKQLVADGLIGKLRVVQVEYPQGWLATALEKSGQKQASWRTDPKQAGAGALGDIGSHAFQLAEFVTGAKVAEVAADVSAIVPGRVIDDNVNVLLRFANGARGSLWASQVAIGHLNQSSSAGVWRKRLHPVVPGTARGIAGRGGRSVAAQRAARRSGHADEFGRSAGWPSRRLHRSLLAALHGFRRARDRAAREPLAEGGVAVRAGCGHGHARHGIHRSGFEIGQGEQRLDEDLDELTRFERGGSMSTEATMTGVMPASAEAKKTFAVCFAALVATSFCFILRAFSIDAWGVEFGLTETQKGELAGVGLWPFAISIVLLSLIIDRIGFKMTLWFAAACHLGGLILILQADGYWSLYLGHVRALAGQWRGRGGHQSADRAQFRHDKTTWLNRLHAGWPAGFVLGGILAIAFPAGMGWRYQMALILIPVITYIVMLIPRHSRRASAWRPACRTARCWRKRASSARSSSPDSWCSSWPACSSWSSAVQWGLIAAMTIGYGLWARSPGRRCSSS